MSNTLGFMDDGDRRILTAAAEAVPGLLVGWHGIAANIARVLMDHTLDEFANPNILELARKINAAKRQGGPT